MALRKVHLLLLSAHTNEPLLLSQGETQPVLLEKPFPSCLFPKKLFCKPGRREEPAGTEHDRVPFRRGRSCTLKHDNHFSICLPYPSPSLCSPPGSDISVHSEPAFAEIKQVLVFPTPFSGGTCSAVGAQHPLECYR